MKQEYTYAATVVKVIDGDTIDLTMDLGFYVKYSIRTRLRGVNAPEVREEAGKMVREELRKLLPVGTPVLVTTYRDPTDKYGRWLAVIEKDGLDICKWLLDNNYAVKMYI
jgi:micrococcal nuclease